MYGYTGHVVNLPQDVASFAQSLPRLPSDLDVIVVRREGANQTHRDFRVRRSIVHRALQWLVIHNQYYRSLGITIDTTALEQLPQDGNVSDLVSVTQETSSHTSTSTVDSTRLWNSSHKMEMFLTLYQSLKRPHPQTVVPPHQQLTAI